MQGAFLECPCVPDTNCVEKAGHNVGTQASIPALPTLKIRSTGQSQFCQQLSQTKFLINVSYYCRNNVAGSTAQLSL